MSISGHIRDKGDYKGTRSQPRLNRASHHRDATKEVLLCSSRLRAKAIQTISMIVLRTQLSNQPKNIDFALLEMTLTPKFKVHSNAQVDAFVEE